MPLFSEGKSYDLYKQELSAWREITDLNKSKQALAVALSLPESDKLNNLKSQLFDKHSIDDLKKDEGLDTVIAFLDSHLGKDDLADSFCRYGEFEDYKRSNESIVEYIGKFEQNYNRIARKGIKLPSEILAFKLLRGASLLSEELMLVISGMDYSKKETLFEQAQTSLKKFKGVSTNSPSQTISAADFKSDIKTEGVFVSEMQRGRRGMRGNWRGGDWRGGETRGRGDWRRQDGRGRSDGYWRQNQRREYDIPYKESIPMSKGTTFMPSNRQKLEEDSRRRGRFQNRYGPGDKKSNPIGKNGYPTTCDSCGSIRHYIRDCPDSWESIKGGMKDVHLAEEEEEQLAEHVVLFTGYLKNELKILDVEARGAAVLDSACSSTVCGQAWMDDYLSSLDSDDRAKVKRQDGHRLFRFGGDTVLKSKSEYCIPAQMVGNDVTIRTDVVESNIPLLLSKPAMKKAKISINIENDTGRVFDKEVDLNTTSSGHYCLPLGKDDIEEVFAVAKEELITKDAKAALVKLHKNFGHPSNDKLIGLLKDSKLWRKEYEDILQDIHDNCDICKEYASTPSRPSVGMPLAKVFNGVVAMDLKQWEGRWILHMIDMHTRYIISVFINRKKPYHVIDSMLYHWVGVFGLMRGILTDNGGEFSSAEMLEVTSILNVNVNTTAANSPWQNGLCERNHQIVDMILLKLRAQFPRFRIEVLLKWANMAKNSMQMWNGYSSHMLVFGRNPDLPNIQHAEIPALDEATSSQVLEEHLRSLHAAREGFVESESSDRIRRALRGKIRASQQVFHHGDKVYYKLKGKERWLGPAKVLFQEGKLVFVKHGGFLHRVSPGRLSKKYTLHDDQPDLNTTGTLEKSNLPVIMDDVVGVNEGDEHNGLDDQQLPVNVEQHDNLDEQFREEPVVRRSVRVFNRENNENLPADVFVTLVPREKWNSPESVAAKQEELNKLKEFKVYDSVPDVGQKTISTRFVLSVKNSAYRARLVARGFEEEQCVTSDSPTIGKCAIRLFLGIAAALRWIVKTTDIKSAFLQGRELDRDVFIRPPKEAGVKPGIVWKLNRCLYGLTDAARQFYLSVNQALRNQDCIQSELDPSLFYYKNQQGVLDGMLVSHIDDFLHGGNLQFDRHVMDSLRENFLAGKLEQKNFTYVGLEVHQDATGVTVTQNDYIDGMEIIKISPERAKQKTDTLTKTELTSYRSSVGTLNWVVQTTRPDVAFDMLVLSMKFQSGVVDDMLSLNKVIKKVKLKEGVIRYPNIGNPKDWKIFLFSDASFANLPDGVNSAMAYIVFLVGAGVCVLNWKANKIVRVVKSTLAAETLALAEGLDDALYVKKMVQDLFPNIKLPVYAKVDNRDLVEAIYSTKMVKDKRLRIELASIKEIIGDGLVEAVSWIETENQLADCMTKQGASGERLLSILRSGRLDAVFSL